MAKSPSLLQSSTVSFLKDSAMLKFLRSRNATQICSPSSEERVSVTCFSRRCKSAKEINKKLQYTARTASPVTRVSGSELLFASSRDGRTCTETVCDDTEAQRHREKRGEEMRRHKKRREERREENHKNFVQDEVFQKLQANHVEKPVSFINERSSTEEKVSRRHRHAVQWSFMRVVPSHPDVPTCRCCWRACRHRVSESSVFFLASVACLQHRETTGTVSFPFVFLLCYVFLAFLSYTFRRPSVVRPTLFCPLAVLSPPLSCASQHMLQFARSTTISESRKIMNKARE